MARPRTMSPPIQFRLPLDVYEALTERAEAKGESPTAYVARTIEEAIRTRYMK